jgi:hypothetical protein
MDLHSYILGKALVEGIVYGQVYKNTKKKEEGSGVSERGVNVSAADFLFSKDVSNWVPTYSPSGAPGGEV